MSKTVLLRKGNFTLTTRHLLLIGILALAFSISFLLRSMPADYGFELNEFDPFFNYRATDYLVQNGYAAYLEWHDDESWYPNGRNVSSSSQNMLHLTAATTYQIFGGGMDLYDFTILFPVVFGSLTTVVIFALVRVIGGTTAGLFAAMLYAISVPVLVRGVLGWFKSEPLGLFYGILGAYLLLSGLRSPNPKIALAKLIGGGIVTAFGLASWGGNQFFILALGIFFLALPFLNKNHRFQLWAVPTFVLSLIGASALFDRPGVDFFIGLGGLAIIGPTMFLVACNLIRMYSDQAKALRNSILFLAGTVISGIATVALSLSTGLLNLPSFRYLNAINPFLISTDPLVDSVSEHATTTISQSFYFHSILMVLAGIGIWLILSKKASSDRQDMHGFALIFGIMGVYISSAFVRLEIFASVAVIILASVGLSVLFSNIFGRRDAKNTNRPLVQIAFAAGIVIFLLAPLNVPAQGNWTHISDIPPTILNGATSFQINYPDWPATFEWMRQSTPEDAVIAAWWDYGYWITTIGERTSLVDNATFSTEQIARVAKMFISSPDDAWRMLQDLGADYVLIFVVAQQVHSGADLGYYTLQGGGEESKKQWIIRIAGEPTSRYIHDDGISGTPHFWENTAMGRMFPFSPLLYFDPMTQQPYQEFQPGTVPLYVKDIKYPADGNGPFRLAYASPSYLAPGASPVLGVFVYEINKDYVPAGPPEELVPNPVP